MRIYGRIPIAAFLDIFIPNIPYGIRHVAYIVRNQLLEPGRVREENIRVVVKNSPPERGMLGKKFLQKVRDDGWDVRPVHAVVPVPINVGVFLSEVDNVL